MITLIPMAGEGQRFKNEGYDLPKPCIPVHNTPMVVQAMRCLPKSDKHLFIIREDHKAFNIQATIQSYYPQASFISIDHLTDGQASTCLLAKEAINSDEELLIGACDNGMIYNRDTFEALKQIADCIVFTFRNNAAVVEHPEHYGWVKPNEDGVVQRISIKKALSDTPKSDHAIVGAFWFKKGSNFVQAAEQMILSNDRINGEFYVDKCLDVLIQNKQKVVVFEIDYYIGWGTPDDLKTWDYWAAFFERHAWL